MFLVVASVSFYREKLVLSCLLQTVTFIMFNIIVPKISSSLNRIGKRPNVYIYIVKTTAEQPSKIYMSTVKL